LTVPAPAEINPFETDDDGDPVIAEPAARWELARRFAAFLIDAFLTMCCGLLLMTFFSVLNLWFDLDAVDLVWRGRAVLTLSYLTFGLLSVLPTSSSIGASFAKHAMGFMVTNARGERISFLHATVRFLAKSLTVGRLGLGALTIFATRDRRALHDLLAGTYVRFRPETQGKRGRRQAASRGSA
jgi:uncharacterized RDD family membrane protein YckC